MNKVLAAALQQADDADVAAGYGEDYDVASYARREMPKMAATIRALVEELQKQTSRD